MRLVGQTVYIVAGKFDVVLSVMLYDEFGRSISIKPFDSETVLCR